MSEEQVNFEILSDRFNERSNKALERFILHLAAEEEKEITLPFFEKKWGDRYKFVKKKFQVKSIPLDQEVESISLDQKDEAHQNNASTDAKIHIVNDENGHFKGLHIEAKPKTLEAALKMGIIPHNADGLQCLSARLVAALGQYNLKVFQRHQDYQLDDRSRYNLHTTDIAQRSILASQELERLMNKNGSQVNLQKLTDILRNYKDKLASLKDNIEAPSYWKKKQSNEFKTWYQEQFQKKIDLITDYETYLNENREQPNFLDDFLKPYGPTPWNPKCLGYFLEQQYRLDLDIQARVQDRVSGYAQRGEKRNINQLAKRILKNHSYKHVYHDPISKAHQFNFEDQGDIVLLNLEKYRIHPDSDSDLVEIARQFQVADRLEEKPAHDTMISEDMGTSESIAKALGMVKSSKRERKKDKPEYGYYWGVSNIFYAGKLSDWSDFGEANTIIKKVGVGTIWFVANLILQLLSPIESIFHIPIRILLEKGAESPQTTIYQKAGELYTAKAIKWLNKTCYPTRYKPSNNPLGSELTTFITLPTSIKGIMAAIHFIKKNIPGALDEAIIKPFQKNGRFRDWFNTRWYDFDIPSEVNNNAVSKILGKYPALDGLSDTSEDEENNFRVLDAKILSRLKGSSQVEDESKVQSDEESLAERFKECIAKSKYLFPQPDTDEQQSPLLELKHGDSDKITLLSDSRSRSGSADPEQKLNEAKKGIAALPYNRTKDASQQLFSLSGDAAHVLFGFFDTTLSEHPQTSGKAFLLAILPGLSAAGLIALGPIKLQLSIPVVDKIANSILHTLVSAEPSATNGFTTFMLLWKGQFMLYEGLHNGPNSYIAEASSQISNHPWLVAAVLVVGTSIGIGLGKLAGTKYAIPFLSNEIAEGNSATIPFLEQFFYGLKTLSVALTPLAAQPRLNTTIENPETLKIVKARLRNYVNIHQGSDDFNWPQDKTEQNRLIDEAAQYLLNNIKPAQPQTNLIINKLDEQFKRITLLQRLSQAVKEYRTANGVTGIDIQDREMIRRWAKSHYADGTPADQALYKSLEANLFPKMSTIDANNPEPKRPLAVTVGLLTLPLKVLSFIVYDFIFCLIFKSIWNLGAQNPDYWNTVKLIAKRDGIEIKDDFLDLCSLLLVGLRKLLGASFSLIDAILKSVLLTPLCEILAVICLFFNIFIGAIVSCCSEISYGETFKIAANLPFKLLRGYEVLTQQLQGFKRACSWPVDHMRDSRTHGNLDSAIERAVVNPALSRHSIFLSSSDRGRPSVEDAPVKVIGEGSAVISAQV